MKLHLSKYFNAVYSTQFLLKVQLKKVVHDLACFFNFNLVQKSNNAVLWYGNIRPFLNEDFLIVAWVVSIPHGRTDGQTDRRTCRMQL